MSTLVETNLPVSTLATQSEAAGESTFFSNKAKTSQKGFDKSHETRSKLLLAAFNEIYHRGFQAASINNILKDTGITKGALYHHFANKKELGYSVLDDVIGVAIRATWITPLHDTDDPITVLKTILIDIGKQMTVDDVKLGCPLNNLAQEMSPIDEGFRNRIAAIYKDWQQAIEAACDRGKAAGKLNHELGSKEVALLFLASIQGALGFAKSVQNLEVLHQCGQGLIERLEANRPKPI